MELTFNCKVHFARGRNGSKRIVEGREPEPSHIEPGNIPRVSKLMALAISLEKRVNLGEVGDYADLARLGQVSRARITQIMNMILLAPDIQEAILFLPRTIKGHDRIRERDLRPIAVIPDWSRQRRMWAELVTDRLMPQ